MLTFAPGGARPCDRDHDHDDDETECVRVALWTDDPARGKADLWKHNGSDPNKPLLLGCKGLVFDVSVARDFYGPEVRGVTRLSPMCSLSSHSLLTPPRPPHTTF